MNIYTNKNKEMTKLIISFIKTVYGKITFLLSYSMFFVFLILSIVLLCNEEPIGFYIFSFISLIAFILGSIHYYKELRIYAFNNKDK